jgi:glycerophosphoryl diester phosphodiesterase
MDPRARVIHHMAALDAAHPPNSLEAVRACLEAGATTIEIDAAALAGEDFLVVHDLDLASQTTGTGLAREMAIGQARDLRMKRKDGTVTDYPVPLLSEVIALLLQYEDTRLQIDLKDERPYENEEPILRLAQIVLPAEGRVIVSSMADWQLRRIAKFAPWLELGFDPGFYLAWWQDYVDLALPPHRMGAYGYLDDQPLAAERVWPVDRYLAERAEVLLHQVPGITTFYAYHGLLAKCLDDGFNWAEACRDAGITLDAWTIDIGRPGMEERVRRLHEAGVDLFTTNTPRELAALL